MGSPNGHAENHQLSGRTANSSGRVNKNTVYRSPHTDLPVSQHDATDDQAKYLVVGVIANGVSEALEHAVKELGLQEGHLLDLQILLRSFALCVVRSRADNKAKHKPY